jgi:conjugal transfer/entry exclusion protein
MSEDLTQNLPGSQNDALAQILSAVQGLDARVQNMDAKVQSMDNRLGTLEQKVDERLLETRPIWEKVVADIERLQTNVSQLHEGQEMLRGEVNTGLRDINRKFSIFNDTLTQMQADYRDIYDRVRDLERQRT